MSEIQYELEPPTTSEELMEHLTDQNPVWRTLGELVLASVIASILLVAAVSTP